MKSRHAAETHPGYRRKNNEDAYLADPAAQLYAVCDGMGGHEDGEIASRIAIETLAERLGDGRAPRSPKALGQALQSAILEAHDRIVAESERRGLETPMGTTVVAAMLLADVAVVASTGDSRAYLAGQAAAARITRDHTVPEAYVDMGLIQADEVRRHPMRNVLVRALGSPIAAEPDLFMVPMARGDRLLLCSDGLSDRVEDQAILATSRGDQPAQGVAGQLIELALEQGGHDNITVVLIEREDGPEPSLDQDSEDSRPAHRPNRDTAATGWFALSDED